MHWLNYMLAGRPETLLYTLLLEERRVLVVVIDMGWRDQLFESSYLIENNNLSPPGNCATQETSQCA